LFFVFDGEGSDIAVDSESIELDGIDAKDIDGIGIDAEDIDGIGIDAEDIDGIGAKDIGIDADGMCIGIGIGGIDAYMCSVGMHRICSDDTCVCA